MPNDYTSFSHEIAGITPEERAWLEAVLKDPDGMGEEEWKAWCDEHWNGPDHAPETWPGFSYTFEQHDDAVRFWFYSDGCGNVEHAILLVETFLSRFRPDQELTISWAHTCSRPIAGAYGGGSYTCNAQQSTEARWMREAIELLDRVHYPGANEAREATGAQAQSRQVTSMRQVYRFLQEIRSCGDDEWGSAIDAAIEAIGRYIETTGVGQPFDEREAAAILAGLRILQTTELVAGHSRLTFAWSDFGDIYRRGGAFEPLAAEAIDRLCERINASLILASCDRREVAAILAGLRVLQSQMSWVGELYVPTSLTEEVRDVLTDGGTIEPLARDEIDWLYQRLGRHSGPGARGESKE
jgi:hypothetical protein